MPSCSTAHRQAPQGGLAVSLPANSARAWGYEGRNAHSMGLLAENVAYCEFGITGPAHWNSSTYTTKALKSRGSLGNNLTLNAKVLEDLHRAHKLLHAHARHSDHGQPAVRELAVLLRHEGLWRFRLNAQWVKANVAWVVVIAESEQGLVRRHPADLGSPDLGSANGENEDDEGQRLLSDDLDEKGLGEFISSKHA